MAFLVRRLLTIQVNRMTPRAPRRRPGKKPAAKDLASKDELAWGRGSAGSEVWETEAGVVGVEEGVGVAVVVLGICFTEMHMPALQV